MDLIGVRTMEFCRRWGFAQDVLDAPYPNDYQQDCVWVTVAHRLRARPRDLSAAHARPARRRARRSASARRRTCSIPSSSAGRPRSRTSRCTTSPSWSASTTDGHACARDGARHARPAQRARSPPTTWSAPTAAPRSCARRSAFRMSGQPALTYTTNVIFRCPDFVALHDKGKAYRFIFIGPEGTWLTIVAINGRDRFRMSIVGTLDKVNAHRGRHPRRADARDGQAVRLRDRVGAALGAARAGGGELRARARLHGRRRRAPDLADRRARHEHRHAGRGRSRLEARRGAERLGRGESAGDL